jgi:Ca2+-binding RTX toxin-like protein
MRRIAMAIATVLTLSAFAATPASAGEGDLLIGTPTADALYGGKGTDLIIGRGGNDVIWAGPGTDTVYGGSGNDTAFVSHRDTVKGVENVVYV